jgi:DNA polymerase I-like protein with 3'-5' exonuclease and polymerase domains
MKLLFLDIETTGLDWKSDSIHGVGYAWEEDVTYYEPIAELSEEIIVALADPEVAVIGSNIRFDLRFLKNLGLTINAQPWDLKLFAQMLDENSSLGLKELTERYLGKEHLSDKAELDRVIGVAGVKHVGDLCRLDLANSGTHFDTISRYCQEDVNNSLKLFYVFLEKLKEMDKAWREQRGATSTPLDYLKEEALPVERVLFEIESCSKWRLGDLRLTLQPSKLRRRF